MKKLRRIALNSYEDKMFKVQNNIVVDMVKHHLLFETYNHELMKTFEVETKKIIKSFRLINHYYNRSNGSLTIFYKTKYVDISILTIGEL